MPGGQGVEASLRHMNIVRPAAAALVLAWLAGCATPVERRSLATGQVDRQAYELNGPDLPALQREAQRLCPTGVDVVRAASQGQSPPAELADDAAIWRRWVALAGNSLQPPTGVAQMVVVCQASGRSRPAAQTAAPAQTAQIPGTAQAAPAAHAAQAPQGSKSVSAAQPTLQAAYP